MDRLNISIINIDNILKKGVKKMEKTKKIITDLLLNYWLIFFVGIIVIIAKIVQ